MKISVLYFDGCPNHRPVVEMVRCLVDAHRLDAEIEEVEVSADDLPGVERLRFLGSPTVQVDGVDIEPAARDRTDFAMSCRVYDTHDGLPSEEMLSNALLADGAPICSPNERLNGAGREGSSGILAVGGAMVSAAISSACCWLPLLLLAFGLSASGVAGVFEQVRPYFLIAAALLLGSGFYFAYFRKPTCKPCESCDAPNPGLHRFNRVMLWAAAVFIIGFATFPYYSPALVRAFDGPASAETSITRQFDIEGMTCEGCAALLESRLKRLPGIASASVSYHDRSAGVVIDESILSELDAYDALVQQIIDATRGAGFTAREVE